MKCKKKKKKKRRQQQQKPPLPSSVFDYSFAKLAFQEPSTKEIFLHMEFTFFHIRSGWGRGKLKTQKCGEGEGPEVG